MADILERCTSDETTVYLPPAQLERKLYEQVNKILEALGGTWTRKVKGHVFTYAPRDALDEAMTSGYAVDQKKALNAFYTPYDVAEYVVDRAQLNPGHHTLEPSCGEGAIVSHILKYLAHVDVCELNDNVLSRTLERFGRQRVRCVSSDFLLLHPGDGLYDRIVANPPFARQQDVAHVSHMLDLLTPAGRVVSVMSAGMLFRDNRPVRELKEKLTAGFDWQIEELPERAFADSGTLVRTVLLTADRR